MIALPVCTRWWHKLLRPSGCPQNISQPHYGPCWNRFKAPGALTIACQRLAAERGDHRQPLRLSLEKEDYANEISKAERLAVLRRDILSVNGFNERRRQTILYQY